MMGRFGTGARIGPTISGPYRPPTGPFSPVRGLGALGAARAGWWLGNSLIGPRLDKWSGASSFWAHQLHNLRPAPRGLVNICDRLGIR
jgi:hypothetical protein